MERSDAELVMAARVGDLAAFGDLVTRYQKPIVAGALHLAGDVDDAEDLAQESFVQAFRSLRKLREPESFRPWLYGILRRVWLKHLSRRRVAAVVSHEQAVNAQINADPQNGHDPALLAELRRLPTMYREVLAARYLQGLTYREIAQALGTSEGNIRIRCLRARQRLREILTASDDLPPSPRLGRVNSTGATASAKTDLSAKSDLSNLADKSDSTIPPTPGGCAGKEQSRVNPY